MQREANARYITQKTGTLWKKEYIKILVSFYDNINATLTYRDIAKICKRSDDSHFLKSCRELVGSYLWEVKPNHFKLTPTAKNLFKTRGRVYEPVSVPFFEFFLTKLENGEKI
jgi:hypothetical protein